MVRIRHHHDPRFIYLVEESKGESYCRADTGNQHKRPYASKASIIRDDEVKCGTNHVTRLSL